MNRSKSRALLMVGVFAVISMVAVAGLAAATGGSNTPSTGGQNVSSVMNGTMNGNQMGDCDRTRDCTNGTNCMNDTCPVSDIVCDGTPDRLQNWTRDGSCVQNLNGGAQTQSRMGSMSGVQTQARNCRTA